MRTIVQTRLGNPSDVLSLVDRPEPKDVPPGSALVRVRLAPIHRGDLQAISGDPRFGDPLPIPEGGRVPGIEGVGTIEALSDTDPARELEVGQRVAFFPVPQGTWSERIVVPVETLVPVPDGVADETVANAFADVLTAGLVVRAGHDLLPEAHKTRSDVTLIQTAGASAVARFIAADLIERGVKGIRLVRTRSSAERLMALLPGAPVIAVEDADWKQRVLDEAKPSKMFLVLDGVGGDLLGEVAGLIEPGGAVVSYGALAGGQADIRPFVPRRLTLKGVSVIAWLDEPEATRRSDVSATMRLAAERPELFEVAGVFEPDAIRQAVAAVEQPGKAGAILIDFR